MEIKTVPDIIDYLSDVMCDDDISGIQLRSFIRTETGATIVTETGKKFQIEIKQIS